MFSLLGLAFWKWDCWNWRSFQLVCWSAFHIKMERGSRFFFWHFYFFRMWSQEEFLPQNLAAEGWVCRVCLEAPPAVFWEMMAISSRRRFLLFQLAGMCFQSYAFKSVIQLSKTMEQFYIWGCILVVLGSYVRVLLLTMRARALLEAEIFFVFLWF